MPTNSTTAEDRLAKLGIHVPDAPTPMCAAPGPRPPTARRCGWTAAWSDPSCEFAMGVALNGKSVAHCSI
jgi:hypothetical protein